LSPERQLRARGRVFKPLLQRLGALARWKGAGISSFALAIRRPRHVDRE